MRPRGLASRPFVTWAELAWCVSIGNPRNMAAVSNLLPYCTARYIVAS